MMTSNISRIKFSGIGLYHFRVHMSDPSLSFCGLRTDFVAFVDTAPLPDHIMDVVKTVAVTVFCGMIFAVFLFYFYCHEGMESEYDY